MRIERLTVRYDDDSEVIMTRAGTLNAPPDEHRIEVWNEAAPPGQKERVFTFPKRGRFGVGIATRALQELRKGKRRIWL